MGCYEGVGIAEANRLLKPLIPIRKVYLWATRLVTGYVETPRAEGQYQAG